jgi:FkbM family methyltransferase
MLTILTSSKSKQVVKGNYDVSWNIDDTSALDFHIINWGVLNDWICYNFQLIIDSSDTVFDIGANVGYISIPIAKTLPKTTTYAFEPDNEVFRLLCDNVSINNLENIVTLPIALQDDQSAEIGKLQVRRSIDGDGKNNLGLSSIQNLELHTIRSQTCQFSTIDKIADKYNIDKLDFIKIDVEGAENRVIAGGLRTIKKSNPIILFENSYILDELTRQNTKASFDLLKEIGYKLFFEIRNEKELVKIEKESNNECNILAVPEMKKDYFLETCCNCE